MCIVSVLLLFKVTITNDILCVLSLKCPDFFHIWPFAHLNPYFFLSFLLQLCQDIKKQLIVMSSEQVTGEVWPQKVMSVVP